MDKRKSEQPDIIERKQERKRIGLGIILSFFCHILILVLLVLSGKVPREKEEEVVLVRVSLADSREKEALQKQSDRNKSQAKKSSQKKSSPKKSAPKKTTEKRETQPSSSTEESESTEKQPDSQKAVPSEKPIEKKQPVEDKDAIKDYEKQQEAERRRLEEEFFSSDTETADSGPESSAEDGDEVDDLLSNLDQDQGDSTDEGIPAPSDTGDKGISWAGGRSRKLLSSSPIKAPEEVLKSGLKFTITLQFEVLENGLISRVTPIESSGSSDWDEQIIEQFKRWQFESAPGVISQGTVSFHFGY